MLLSEIIKESREKAGRALEAAKKIGEQMRSEPAKAAELQEQFDRAHSDAMASIKEVQRVEKEMELDSAAAFMAQSGPDADVTHRAKPESQDTKTVARRETHKMASVAFIKHGLDRAREILSPVFGPEETHALLGTSSDLGGFLFPDDFRNEVLKDLPQFSVMRGICRVERTGRSALVLPTIASATSSPDIYASGYTGAWKAEGYVTGGTAPTVQNQPTFGQERIPVHGWQPNAIEVSQELLEDSGANLDSILAETIAETMGLDEDAAVTSGTGVGQPEGFLNGGSPNPSTDLGTATTFTYAGIVSLFTALPGQYRMNGKFVMNSATYGKLLLLESTAGFPLFPPNSLPGTLFTKPVIFNEFMPSVASAAKTIVFGDFNRGYILVDRAELRIQRLTERFAPNVGILPIKRTGGQVVRPRALRIGKHAA